METRKANKNAGLDLCGSGIGFFGGHLDKLVLESKCKGWLKAVFKHINI